LGAEPSADDVLSSLKRRHPQLGEWNDAVILARYGDVPDDLAPYPSD
jgi:hypothetical protein